MSHLEKMLQHISRKHVYIQTHNFPDPDAIASAYGLSYLLEKKGISSTICYKGVIDRFSTLKMIDIQDIKIVNLDNVKELTEEDEVILVDAQKGNANIIDMDGEEIICIDHHQTYEKVEYRYADIRPKIGACSSIITEYFIAADIEISRNVATALIYGIKVDTANLCRGMSMIDLNMYYYLYTLCDRDILQKLEHNTLQFSDLHAYANAINSIKVYRDVSFANTGKDCPEALIASISDFMMALAEVCVSIVYSIRNNGIKLSVRSEYKTYDVGKLCSVALKGIGNGGGHENMAGGFVPFLNAENRDEDMIQVIERRFIETISKVKITE